MAPLSTLTNAQLRDRIRGCIFGCAVGDAYGLATEFMTKRTAVRLYGNGPIAFGREPGYPVWEDDHRHIEDRNDFTDDTDQMLLILQSLNQTGDGRLNPINLACRLREWYHHGIPELGTDPGRGLGFTVGAVMDKNIFTTNPFRAAFEVWDQAGRNLAPNGAVMRTAVIGLESFWDESRVVENAMAAAKITHADPRSVMSALIASVLISRLLRGGGADAAIDSQRIWNARLSDPAYEQELLAYLQRGTNLRGEQSLNPPYDPLTPANRFEPKDYDALKLALKEEEEAEAGGSHRAQFKDRDPRDWNKDRPEVILRPEIGWAGVDQVGEDAAMGALARSVVSDYLFLVIRTDVAPASTQAGEVVQQKWAQDLQAHCFPQNIDQLALGNGAHLGYALKCVGVAYYGVTRRIDPSPTTLEYVGPVGLFRGLVEEVTLAGGDADTNCAAMGSLLGARFGLESGMPEGWWKGMQHVSWLQKTIDQFADRVLASYDAQNQ
ncbi:hypothetical protein BGZ99_003046 [Dissophora globulifera]|uniref:ADP-ribosylglycohydrolase n=1 Tax=Dissophora globulifera TaxID=979702 RepID=A0A9P6V141_9FUNG|nr:hypothetical protein BGZ99_003046 [Dissophora globulifera]